VALAGFRTGVRPDGIDGPAFEESYEEDEPEEELAPNGMHMPEYRAYCSDLYERYQGGDEEAIREHATALCDQ
jgi:hypothetical protein